MKRALVDRSHRFLSVSRQCRILSLSRSSLYYQRKGESPYNLELMTLIDKQFMETPFYGVRQMTWHLKSLGHKVNKKRIRRLMRLMGLMPIYQRPNTSKPNKAHKTYPYLLNGLNITQANHVWCADITYIPMRKGFRSPPSNRWRAGSPGRHHGLGYAACPVMEVIKHAGRRLLC